MPGHGESMKKDLPAPRDATTTLARTRPGVARPEPETTGTVAPPAVAAGHVSATREAIDHPWYLQMPIFSGAGRDTARGIGAAASAMVTVPRGDGPCRTAVRGIGPVAAAPGANALCHAPVETAEIVA